MRKGDKSVKYTLPPRTLFNTSTDRMRNNHTLIVFVCRLLVCFVHTIHIIVNLAVINVVVEAYHVLP